jgi:hypothetical protein
MDKDHPGALKEFIELTNKALELQQSVIQKQNKDIENLKALAATHGEMIHNLREHFDLLRGNVYALPDKIMSALEKE